MNIGNELRKIADELDEIANYYEDRNLQTDANKVLEIAHVVESLESDRKSALHMAEIVIASLRQEWDT